jgi:hypothetical protein
VPEWPIGTALKAVAGSNVSRGFESRPLCVTRYRLDRAHLMVLAGVCFIVAAVSVVVAFLIAGGGALATGATIIAAGIAVVALLVAAIANLRPPVVLTLDAAGYRARGRHGDGAWKQVESVEVVEGLLRFTDGSGAVTAFPLRLVDRTRRADLIREVYDRLNTANGYRRFDPTGGS